MASKEIAVRSVVWFGPFRNWVEVPLASPLPKNTLDPRYRACIDHRTACDCREAMLAEDRGESRAELEQIRRVFDEVLEGHATWVETPGTGWHEQLQCKCTGCEIARRTYMRFASAVEAQPVPPRFPTVVVDPECLVNDGEVLF